LAVGKQRRDGTAHKSTSPSKASTSAGSSESGDSQSKSSALVDGFALFALAIQDHLRSKLKAAAGAGDVQDEMVYKELRRLWKEMGESQRLEWQSQAAMVPPVQSQDSSSLNEDEDDSSQDSSGASLSLSAKADTKSEASEASDSKNSDASKATYSTEEKVVANGQQTSAQPVLPMMSTREELLIGQGCMAVGQLTNSVDSATMGSKTESLVSGDGQRRLPDIEQVVRGEVMGQLMQGFAAGATRPPSMDTRLTGLGNMMPMGNGCQPHMSQVEEMFFPQTSHSGASMSGMLLDQRLLQQTQMNRFYGSGLLPGPFQDNKPLPSMMLPSASIFLPRNSLGQGTSDPSFASFAAGQQLAASQGMASPHSFPVYMPFSMGADNTLSGSSLGRRGGGANLPPQGASRLMANGWQGQGREGYKPLPYSLKRGADGKTRQPAMQGPRPQPEPPQVRTMTFVCDLFSPYEGQISLQVLAEQCKIVDSGFGIVGLSCQLQTPEGAKVVKRGQVKDARRHFAHQAQLRLSLASSPNLSVKVFSTGRLQIAGCHDETSCMEAVRIVAHALNDIFERSTSIMKRQVKAGQDAAGVKLDGKIDVNKLPLPKIVMINCSFDSGMAALGYGLDPHKLTELLHKAQETSASVEEVSYNPDQRYTGVKVKFKPTVVGANGQKAALSDREIFIGMFPSGKAVITGAVRWEEVSETYEFAKSMLCDNFDHLRVPLSQSEVSSRKKQRKSGPGSV